MSQEKYIGLDVHQATISAAVMDAGGKLLMECLLETKAATILEFIQGLRGTLSLTFEEAVQALDLVEALILIEESETVSGPPRLLQRLQYVGLLSIKSGCRVIFIADCPFTNVVVFPKRSRYSLNRKLGSG